MSEVSLWKKVLRVSEKRAGSDLRKVLLKLPEGTMEVLLKEAGRAYQGSIPANPLPGQIFRLRQGVRLLAGIVKATRFAVFSRLDPPFATRREAEDWLLDEVARGYHRLKGNPGELLKALSDLPAIEWFGNTDTDSTHIPAISKKLRTLWSCVEFASRFLAIDQACLTATILSEEDDLPPEGLQKWLSLAWQERDKALSFSGEEKLTKREKMLLDAASFAGLPPKSQGRGRNVGRTEYWERLAEAHRNLYGNGSPEALRRRWERLTRRLGTEEIERLFEFGFEGDMGNA